LSPPIFACEKRLIFRRIRTEHPLQNLNDWVVVQMRKQWEKVVLWVVTLSVLGVPSRLPAPPDDLTGALTSTTLFAATPNIPVAPAAPAPTAPPSSANAVTGLFTLLTGLAVYNDPTNWVIYAAGATYFYQRTFFKSSHDFAKGTRQGIMRQLEAARATEEVRRSTMNQANALVDEIALRVPEAERAAEDLNAQLKTIKRRRKKKEVALFPNGLGNFAEFLKWSNSAEGQAFFAEKPEWKVRYDQNVSNMTEKLDAPLAELVRLTNTNYVNSPVPNVRARDFSTGQHRPGQFESQAAFSHLKKPVAMAEIAPFAQGLAYQCKLVAETAGLEVKRLAKESNWFHFWRQPKHIRAPLIHAAATTGLAAGTFWLYRTYEYDRRQQELAKENAKISNANSDVATWITSPEGRKTLGPYYRIIQRSFIENKAEIIAMLKKNYTVDEAKGVDFEKLFDSTIDSGAFLVAVEQATMQATKLKQGDRVANVSLMQMLENAKTDQNVRAGLFKSFNKEVFRGVVNNLWADLSVGDPSDNFDSGVLKTMLKRSDELVQGDLKIQAPPSTKEVPTAPGTLPPSPATVSPILPPPGTTPPTAGPAAVDTQTPVTSNAISDMGKMNDVVAAPVVMPTMP